MIDISAKAIKLVQKDLPLYVFGMKAGDLLDIAYILPKSRDDPEAIERALDRQRVEEISKYVQRANCYLPNAIIINFDTTDIDFASFSEDDSSAIFTIRLPEHKSPDELEQEVLTALNLDKKTKENSQRVEAEIEKRRSKIAYVIDGQHRLKGLEEAGRLDLMLPVIALKNADVKKAAKIFADINGEQEPVSANQILLIRYEIGDLPGLDEQATKIAHELNSRNESPLKGKVKIYEQDKGTWIQAISLQRLLYPIIGTGALQGMPVDEQVSNIINFLNAIKEQNPDAFGADRREYILTQPRGIEAALGIFERVWRRCQIYEGGNFDRDSILRQVKRLETMNWKKDKYGALKGAGGVILLVDKLRLLLPERDEWESKDYQEVVQWFKRDQLVL